MHDKVTAPQRSFAASNALGGWSALEMAAITDCARECFRLLENDPAKVATTEYR